MPKITSLHFTPDGVSRHAASYYKHRPPDGGQLSKLKATITWLFAFLLRAKTLCSCIVGPCTESQATRSTRFTAHHDRESTQGPTMRLDYPLPSSGNVGIPYCIFCSLPMA